MMDERLTIIIGYRNRELERVGRCLQSLAAQTKKSFRTIFVDYGSTAGIADQVRLIATQYDFCDYIYTETRGLPWNRSQALNIGGRLVQTPSTMFTDVDMIFAPDFVEKLLNIIATGSVYICQPYLLPRRFNDWKNVVSYVGEYPLANPSALGSCQVMDTSLVQKVQGFDEYYRYWGREDRDLHDRLLSTGVEATWITDKINMFHQWHPASNYRTPGFIPDGMWGRMQLHFLQYHDQVKRNGPEWGKVYHESDRPVLSFLDMEKTQLEPDKKTMLLDLDPGDNASLGEFVTRFWNLAPGQALAVNHAFYGRPGRWSRSRPVRVLNRLLFRAGIDVTIGPGKNLLHNFIVEFIDCYPDMIADCYLGFPMLNGVSVLIRK